MKYLIHNVNIIKEKERLRNCLRLKKSKETWQVIGITNWDFLFIYETFWGHFQNPNKICSLKYYINVNFLLMKILWLNMRMF